MRRIAKYIAAVLLIAVVAVAGFFINSDSVLADGEIITGDDSFAGLINTAIPINNVQITGSGNPMLPVRLNVTNGTLAMSTVTGLTFTGSSSGSTLQFSGALSDLNAALATLTYTRSSVGTDTLEVALVESGQVFFSENNHLYEYVASPNISWTAARTAAAAREKYGATGYLTTITSLAENDFVAERLLGAGWMGASDATTEGDWKWVTGPESGTSFWLGNGAGSTVGGGYANWNNINLPNSGTGAEPNNSGDEDCGQFLAGSTGLWNDLPCGNLLEGYVVEYGAPGDLPEVASLEATISTLRTPTFSSPASSSASNAINVDFTTYSDPQSGTLRLVFEGETTRTIVLDNLTAGHYSFSIDPSDVLGSDNVASSLSTTIPDDNYDVRLEYSDTDSGYFLSNSISSFSLDTQAPITSVLAPANNDTGVGISSNLSITFNENVTVATGNVVIYNADDDTVFATLPINGARVTGGGTDTLTIDPVSNLQAGRQYYVKIDDGAVSDAVGNDFGGIGDSLTWSFTALAPPEISCVTPVSTQTTIFIDCDNSPSGWGSNSWEIRYRKVGYISYTTHALADTSSAETTIEGLDAETEYEIQVRFTNDYGTSDWETLTKVTSDDPDDDDDGILDVDENAAPNGGDANGDGILDRNQPYVTSFVSQVTNKYVVLEVSDECTIENSTMMNSDDLQGRDSEFTYPTGLMDFTLNCGSPGFEATIKQFYYGLDGTFSVRKYNTLTQKFSTVDGATVADVAIGGSSVKVASYMVKDGGSLDQDGVENGEIQDPAGLGVEADESALAETGFSIWATVAVGVSFLGAAVIILALRRKFVS